MVAAVCLSGAGGWNRIYVNIRMAGPVFLKMKNIPVANICSRDNSAETGAPGIFCRIGWTGLFSQLADPFEQIIHSRQ